MTTVTTFGRVVSAEFIGALVQGLPELPEGTPALALFADVLRRGADAVPRGYGNALVARLYQLARRTFWDHDVIQEAMLALVTTAVRGRLYLTPGCTVEQAQRYVFVAVANAAKNVLRSRLRKRGREMPLIPARPRRTANAVPRPTINRRGGSSRGCARLRTAMALQNSVAALRLRPKTARSAPREPPKG